MIRMIRKNKRLEDLAKSNAPIKNLSFVGQEYWGCDDEIVESRDGLFADFGGDNYCISSNALYLGLARGDDGCEPLEEETEAEALDRYLVGIEDDYSNYAEDYEHYRSLEEADVRVAEAVAHALRLQKFFRKQAEECKLAKQINTDAGELALNEPEVEEVWQMRQVCHSYGGAEGSTVRPGKNSRRPWIGDRGGATGFDYDAAMILAEVIVNNRRYRVSRAA